MGIEGKDQRELSERQIKLMIFGVSSVLIAAVFVVGDVVIALSPFLRHFYVWFMGTFGLKVTQLLMGIVVIVLGVGAFFFKVNAQISYGAVEIMFAWVAGVITAHQIRPGADSSGQMATLIGAIYIVSRGLGNIKEGIKARVEKAKLKALVSP
jgi:hypothetical protein